MRVQQKQVKSMSLPLTDEQKEAIRRFWAETSSIGTVEIEVDVVGDKISPASIQVGTAK
jgi:F0F1-type ATP synthase delta subunit